MHSGETLALQQQIANLRLVGESGMLRMLLPVSAVTGLVALVAFCRADSQNWGVIYLFVACCSGMVALAAWLAAGHARTAAIATGKGRREHALLHLHDNADADDIRQFHGRLESLSGGARAWELDFAPANGWKPQPRVMQVEAVFLSDIAWPVLVLCGEQGLLWPRSQPRRVASGARAA